MKLYFFLSSVKRDDCISSRLLEVPPVYDSSVVGEEAFFFQPMEEWVRFMTIGSRGWPLFPWEESLLLPCKFMACFWREPTSRVPVISLTTLCIIDKSVVLSSIVCYCHNSQAETAHILYCRCVEPVSVVFSTVFHTTIFHENFLLEQNTVW